MLFPQKIKTLPRSDLIPPKDKDLAQVCLVTWSSSYPLLLLSEDSKDSSIRSHFIGSFQGKEKKQMEPKLALARLLAKGKLWYFDYDCLPLWMSSLDLGFLGLGIPMAIPWTLVSVGPQADMLFWLSLLRGLFKPLPCQDVHSLSLAYNTPLVCCVQNTHSIT